jgi:4a-hydroxytetrahydrobiopterin dehydratase
MNRVADQCKKSKHHPEWTNIYNRTHIRWTTHNPAGLSEKDTAMARACDEIAAELGEIVEEGGNGVITETGRLNGAECCGGDGKKR